MRIFHECLHCPGTAFLRLPMPSQNNFENANRSDCLLVFDLVAMGSSALVRKCMGSFTFTLAKKKPAEVVFPRDEEKMERHRICSGNTGQRTATKIARSPWIPKEGLEFYREKVNFWRCSSTNL
jgi:hypothetical protein